MRQLLCMCPCAYGLFYFAVVMSASLESPFTTPLGGVAMSNGLIEETRSILVGQEQIATNRRLFLSRECVQYRLRY
jgi:hypothetical protein